jgi:hypothetical protein
MVFYSYISPCTSTIPLADAMSLATYIEEHKTRRPPDHLFSEWIQRPGSGGQLAGRDSSAKGRPFFAFRHNILYHVGSQSSLGHESRIIVPKCYDTLQDWLQPCVSPSPPDLYSVVLSAGRGCIYFPLGFLPPIYLVLWQGRDVPH